LCFDEPQAVIAIAQPNEARTIDSGRMRRPRIVLMVRRSTPTAVTGV
jgi:hypothetical protein